ncbi:MAG: GTPase [Deltaproteobacteria bacterium]|nr:GTPase [Deltaproteobacteria bacterium]
MRRFRCIVMGAAGRDFHDFLTFLREHGEQFEVIAFTAAQIPYIDARSFPAELAGTAYPADIPIHPEEDLAALIQTHEIDFVFLSYSDLSHEEVMHRASAVQAAGASFALLGPSHTELRSKLPVVAVTAVRTGAGKSPLCQAIAGDLSERGLRVGIVRHPMPYGDLRSQVVQRFASAQDLDLHDCTIEEREEYEPYLERGLVIYAGVDYARILAQLESESDVVLWDGGNNDGPFIRPDLLITVADALRPGHEVTYYPGETNFRRADIIVINKVEGAAPGASDMIRASAGRINPSAQLVEADLSVDLEDASAVAGKRVLVVEDGPTLTHGGMATGAGYVAAQRFGAGALVDPRPHAVGSIAEAFRRFPHLGPVLPALGYSAQQREELAETVEGAGAELVIDASPARLDRFLDSGPPIVRVFYRFEQRSGADLLEAVRRTCIRG